MNQTLLNITFAGLVIALHSHNTVLADINVTEHLSNQQTLLKTLKTTRRNAIYGYVWHDENNNGRQDSFETPLENALVYLDLDNNGQHDSEEPSIRTQPSGSYYFLSIEPGDYTVRQELPFGWRNVSTSVSSNGSSDTATNNDPIDTIKIIGGDDVTPQEYPFMASVGSMRNNRFSHFCGGSFISDRWIVTAAHCSEGASPESVHVLAGTNDITNGSGQILDVENIIIHPNYEGVSSGFDVALWELKTPVTLGKVETISMLTQDNAALADAEILSTAVGWGVSNLASELLQDVHVPIVDPSLCADAYPDASNFDTQICAGALEDGGIDACQGDSGGPLLVRDVAAQQWRLAGVTSYGTGCALAGFPGVWARVSELSDWVKSIATEPSEPYQLTLSRYAIEKVNFAVESTLYEPSRTIDPRWQLVNFTVNNDPTTEFSMDWRIIDEAEAVRTMSCSVDPDGPGVVAAATETPCFVGSNHIVLPPISEAGVYLPTLVAQLGETQFARQTNGFGTAFTVGTPDSITVEGELTQDDQIDPNYISEYFIDYYEIADISKEKAITIDVLSSDFSSFVVLIDADQVDPDGRGGVITDFFVSEPGETATLSFFPDPDINHYLIGVSTYNPQSTGAYTLTLMNDGNPVEASSVVLASETPDILMLPRLPQSIHIASRKRLF